MAGITHTYVSGIADGGDGTLVQPSNWNAVHTGLTIVRKTADETVNNDTTLQNDDDLVIAVGANDVWLVHLCLFMISATATPDIDWAFAVPSGGAVRTLSYYAPTSPLAFGDGTAEATLAIDGTEKFIQVFLLYIGGGTAGNLQLQWAQHVATEEDTKVCDQSFMLGFKLA